MHEQHKKLMHNLKKFKEVNQELKESESGIHKIGCSCKLCKRWHSWYKKVMKAIIDYDINKIDFENTSKLKEEAQWI